MIIVKEHTRAAERIWSHNCDDAAQAAAAAHSKGHAAQAAFGMLQGFGQSLDLAVTLQSQLATVFNTLTRLKQAVLTQD